MNFSEFVAQSERTSSLLEEKSHFSACVLLLCQVPGLEDLVADIDESDLFYDDDFRDGIETESHCTLLYGLDVRQPLEDIVRQVDDLTARPIQVSAIDRFENDDYDVLKLNCDAEFLHRYNARLKTLPHKSNYPDYSPHITLAYMQPGTARRHCRTLDAPLYIMPTELHVTRAPDDKWHTKRL